MARATPLWKSKATASIEANSFSRYLRELVEQGAVALNGAYILRPKIIELLEWHSAELELLGEDASEIFLGVCDMMASGSLAKMDPDAFKVYLVLIAYKDTAQRNILRDSRSLSELTGIRDLSALGDALEKIRREGYIDSEGSVVAYVKKHSGLSRCALDPVAV